MVDLGRIAAGAGLAAVLVVVLAVGAVGVASASGGDGAGATAGDGAAESPPPELPEPELERPEHGGASHGEATIAQTATYSLVPGTDDEVALVREFEIDDSVDELRVGVWSSERVVSADGFEETDTRVWTWTGETDTPSLTMRRELVRAAESDGDGWAIAAQAELSWSAAGSQVPTFGTHYRTEGAGAVGNHLVVVGEHEEYVRDVAGDDLRVVVPDGVSPAASPAEAADALAAFGRSRYPGHVDRDALLAVAGRDATGYEGAYQGNDVVVRADQGLGAGSAWFHEFGHTRQRFNETSDLAWLLEGHAEYLAHLGPARQDRLGYDGFRDGLRRGLDHGGVVLADESTWSGGVADYERGALVVHAVDAAIHRETGGERSVADALERLNAIDSGPVWEQEPVGHDEFVEAVRAVGGDEPARLADRLATTTEQPAVVDADAFESLVGPHDAGRVAAVAGVEDDVAWFEVDGADARLGTLRHDVPEGDGPAPDRSVPVHLVAHDADAATDGFALEVGVGDGEALTIAGADVGPAFEHDFGAVADVSADAERVRLAADGASSLTDPDAVRDGGLVLGTVIVEPVGDGPARVEPMNVTVGDDAARLSASRTAGVRVERQPVPELDGTTPRDVDADGHFRDVTGDGVVGHDDVARFFRHHYRASVQEHAVLFDFSGSGAVGHGDVVALFEHVAMG